MLNWRETTPFSAFIPAHSNAGDAHANSVAEGADSGYASLSSSSFSHLAREEWRVVSVGLTTLCTQAEAICSPTDAIASATSTSYHADAWIPLVQAILAGLTAGPARCGQLAADAAVAAATAAAANPSTSVFSDERFTDVAGDSGRSFECLIALIIILFLYSTLLSEFLFRVFPSSLWWIPVGENVFLKSILASHPDHPIFHSGASFRINLLQFFSLLHIGFCHAEVA